jgi:hypothetical protein
MQKLPYTLSIPKYMPIEFINTFDWFDFNEFGKNNWYLERVNNKKFSTFLVNPWRFSIGAKQTIAHGHIL